MAIRTLTFPSLNISAQKGDEVYYAEHNGGQSGKNMNVAILDTKPKLLGIITDIVFPDTILVDDVLGGSPVINSDMMFMFQKPKEINTSGVTGYYAEAEYRNHTTLPCELFATAADYVVSSK